LYIYTLLWVGGLSPFLTLFYNNIYYIGAYTKLNTSICYSSTVEYAKVLQILVETNVYQLFEYISINDTNSATISISRGF
jgi:hypothetical protein